MTPRVLVVDRVLRNPMDGVARYMQGILMNAEPQRFGLDLRVLAWGQALSPDDWGRRVATAPPPGRWARRVNHRLLTPIAQRWSRAALFHFPTHNLPTNWSAGNQPCIISIHGAAAWYEERWGVPAGRAARIARAVRAAGDRLHHVITVSHWSKREIARRLGISDDRISVIYHGVEHARFRPLEDRARARQWVEERTGSSAPYLLHVGPCAPRKNVIRLIQALGRLRDAGFPHHLCLVGRAHPHGEEVRREIGRQRLEPRVHWCGKVTDDELVRFYNGASVFIFPSLYEGFGLPVLEAMACGTPVVTSAVSALPEVAGGAAALVEEPTSPDNLMTVIRKVLDDDTLAEYLREAGMRRAASFTWAASAEAHLRCYQQLLTRSPA